MLVPKPWLRVLEGEVGTPSSVKSVSRSRLTVLVSGRCGSIRVIMGIGELTRGSPRNVTLGSHCFPFGLVSTVRLVKIVSFKGGEAD